MLAIDDGSTDEGPRIVAELGDPRVRALSSAGVGLPRALEVGRAAARGALLARMDADDVTLPGRFDAQRAYLLAHPTVGAVGARVDVIGPRVGEGMRAYVAWQNSLTTPAEHRRDLFVEAPLCHPSVMLRASALDAVGGYRDVAWAEDYDLWLRLDAAGWGLAKIPHVYLHWYHRPGRATFASARYTAARFREARAAFLAPRLRGARPLAMWGAGATGKRLAAALEAHGIRFARWIDIDEAKIGRTRRGAPVVGPNAIAPGEELIVVAVGARGARAEVRAHLAARGFTEGVDFVCAA